MNRFAALLFLVVFPGCILSQTVPPKGTAVANPGPIQHGVVVEEVVKNSAVEKAGLREGDVLLAWHRGDAGGDIESPFDVVNLAMEQGPRGEVSLKGLHGSDESRWTVELGFWGLKTRPRLPENLLPQYLEGRALAQSGKWTEAAEKWRTVAGQAGDSIPSLVRIWLLSQTADAFAQGREWKNADDVYQQVLQETGEPLSPAARCLLLRAWANTYKQRSDWVNAENYYQQSISERQKSGAESLIIAASLNDLGTISRVRGNLAKAEEYFRQALEISQKLAPGSLAVAASFNSLGNVAAQRGDLAKAEDLYRQALEIRQKLAPGGPDVASIFHNLGIVASKRGDLVKAEEYARQALEIRQKLVPGSLDVAVSLNLLGVISKQQGNLETAEDFYHRSLEITQKLAPGGLAVASSFDNLGIVATQRLDFAKAEDFYGQALEIKQKLVPGSLEVALTLNNLGEVASDRGNLARAEEYHRQALKIEQELAPGSLDVADTFLNLGILASDRGDLARAEEYLQQNLEIRRKLNPGTLVVATTFNHLGFVASQQGDLVKAEEYFRQALKIEQKLAPGGLGAGNSLNGLAIVARRRQDLTTAEEYLRQALEIAQKLEPESPDVAATLNNLGNVTAQRGDLANAEEYYRRALEIRQKQAPGGLDVAASLFSLGNIATQRGDLARATEYLRGGLDIMQKLAPASLMVSETLAQQGSVAEQHRDLEKAEQYHRQELAIRQKLAPQSGDYAESLAAFAKILRQKEQLDEAAQLYQQAVNVLQKQMAIFGGSDESRSGFRSNHLDLYMAYIDLLVSQKQTEMAFQVLERSRAQGLLETFRAAQVDIRKGVNVELIEKERSLRELLTDKSNRRMQLLKSKSTEAQVSTLDKEIQEILKEYQDIEGQIRETSPAYATLTQPQPLSVKEVQQSLLDSDSLLLEYALGGERSYVFAVTQDSIAAFALPKRAEIEAAARELYGSLSEYKVKSKVISRQGARALHEDGTALARLSQMLLGPLAGQLNKKRLLVVSDGALQYIPFAVLSNPGNPAAPLIAEHEIVTLPSIAALAVLRQDLSGRKPAPKAVAILADPVFDVHDDRLRLLSKSEMTGQPDSSQMSEQSGLERSAQEAGVVRGGIFPRLPFSRREAEAIYSIAQKGDAKEALDFEASKATAMGAQLRDYRIVHFATHGLLNNEHPELSGLVFSLVDQQGKSQDGFLRLLDIYNLDLNADLVVLSACQTALGKQSAEEGLVGLTRGFMYAGAPRVMASLWKVDDEATAELMKRFYEGVLKNGQTPAQALRKAQMWMSQQKRWRPPYYWAGFVLQGEWR